MLKGLPRLKLMATLCFMFALLLIWDILLYKNPTKATNWNYGFNAAVAWFYILAYFIALFHIRKSQLPKPSRRILLYLGFAAFLWGLAFLIWTYYNLILKVDIPYPSVADMFFLLAYPLLGLALWDLHDSYGSLASPKVVRDSIIIVAVSTVVIFAFLNRPDLSPDLGLTKNLLNVAYSLGDVLLVAMALIELRSGQAKKHKGLYLLIGFLLLQAGGDFLFAYLNNSGKYWNGDISDLFFGASGFMLALALAQNNLVSENSNPSKPKGR